MSLFVALVVLVLVDIAAVKWGKDSTRLSDTERGTERFGALR